MKFKVASLSDESCEKLLKVIIKSRSVLAVLIIIRDKLEITLCVNGIMWFINPLAKIHIFAVLTNFQIHGKVTMAEYIKVVMI